MYHPNIYKTSMCMNYNNPSGNRCKWGYYCTHAHGQDDVRTPVNRRCNNGNAVDTDGFPHALKDTTLKTHARVLSHNHHHHPNKELIKSVLAANAMNINVTNDNNTSNNNNITLNVNTNNNVNNINNSNNNNAINNNNNNNNNKNTITIPMNRPTNVTSSRSHEHGHNDMVIYPVVMDKFGPMTSSMQSYASYGGDTHKFTSKANGNINSNTTNTTMNAMDVPLTYSHYPLWSPAVALPVSSSSSSSLVVHHPHHQPIVSKNDFVTTNTNTHAKVKMPVMPDLDSIEPAFLEYLSRPAVQGGGIGLSDTDFETDDQDLDLDLFPLNVSLPSPSPPLPMWEDVNPLQPLYPLSTVQPFEKQPIPDVKSSSTLRRSFDSISPQSHLQAHTLQSSQLQKHKQKRTCDLCGLFPLSMMQFIPLTFFFFFDVCTHMLSSFYIQLYKSRCNHVLCANCSSKDMKCSLCLANISSFTHL
ncbi:hypothetical protein RFI_03987 [Reticulomyxa filosa]|uniref:C3H1-type domain-containing protein n=1 Tax=Reticulomyxa filosa TaxID=46433 RepID=X6P3K2_RETFI|nr:hypothetical protein RFI_03987 [Reticulomyxa filosa]|eukprot:ETO33120.1 hypothetical protein RFI_03987 [Reticulomyxa filosa]